MSHVEPIAFVLERAGIDLSFPLDTLKGIPGTEVYSLRDFDSVYDAQKQDFSFQVSSEAFRAAGLRRGDAFTITTFGQTYLFKVEKYPDDLTGWLTLGCTLEEFY